MSAPFDPVGVIEIARRRDVARETAHAWKRNGKFPEPQYDSVNGYPAWEWAEIDARFEGTIPGDVAVCNPVGTQEIAVLLGVAERTVHTWKSARKILPEPEYESVNGFSAWEFATIVEWAIETGRGDRLPAEFRPNE